MTKTALILVDIQNDYFDGGLMTLPEMDTAATNAARLLARARAEGTPLFHIQHVMGSANAPFFRPGTEGAEIHAAVRPNDGEPVFVKNRPNAFVGTGLEAALCAADIDHVTICGAMSQMCVDATARAAVDMGFAVTVAEDACAAANVTFGGVAVPAQHVHAAIMAPLAASYGKVVSTTEAEAALRAA